MQRNHDQPEEHTPQKKSLGRASKLGAWQNHSSHTKEQHAGAHHTSHNPRTYKSQGAKDTADAAHQARRQVKESYVPKDNAHRQHHARTPVNRCQGAKDTRHTTHEARRLVNKRQVAKDTAHTTHQAHASGTRDKWPRTLHTQNTGHARG